MHKSKYFNKIGGFFTNYTKMRYAFLYNWKKVLSLLALAHSHGNVQPTSGGFIKKYNLTSASSVQRNLMALQEKDIITNSSGQYRIYDYFLNFWLNKK